MTGWGAQNHKILANFSRSSRQIYAICNKKEDGWPGLVRLHFRNVIIDVIWRIFLFTALKSCSTKYCIDQSSQYTSCGDFV
jgi:hypothetical protein